MKDCIILTDNRESARIRTTIKSVIKFVSEHMVEANDMFFLILSQSPRLIIKDVIDFLIEWQFERIIPMLVEFCKLLEYEARHLGGVI